MRPFYGVLAGAGALLLAGMSTVQAATEIEFWHAMSGALGERVAGVTGHQHGPVPRIGDVADVDLDGRHPGQPQQIPGPAVGPAVA